MSAAAASEELMASAVTQVSDDLSRTEEIDVALDEDAIVAAPVDDATTAATPTVPSIAEQASIVRDLDTGEHKVELKEGDYWFLVDAKWFQKWQEYVGFERDMVPSNVPPGPIDNRALLSDPNDHTTLYSFVQELQDFMLVPDAMWRHIHAWYGGGPAVPRVVVRRNYSRALAVDVHLHVIELLRSSALTADPIKLCTSKSAKVRHVREHGCKLFGLAETDVQLWDYHQRQKSKLLADLDATLAEENIIRNQFVLFEERGPDGRFPRSTAHARDFQTSVNATPGQCGLSNLGNTCFMNSALQCMSATAPLRRFFLSRQYEADINKDNPLGCGGELALVFGELLDALWAGRYHSFAPREFKHQLERFAHQFQGYQQHDSQELLAFLLDGLHEDLNRVKKKPFVEAVEGCGRPDQVVADEAWEAHKKRNDSIVVDEFMGQLKSTVECDVCDRVSVTFDPFMYLSVPLPQVTTRTITVTLVRRDGSSPMRYAVTLEKDLNVGALKSGLSALCGIPVNCIVIADVFMSKIHADYEDHVPLTQISARDEIYGYEILSLSKPPPSKPPPAPPVGDAAAATAAAGGATPIDVDPPTQPPPPPSDMVPLEEATQAEDLVNVPTVPTRAQAAGFDDDGDDDGFGGGAKRAKPTAMKDSFDSDNDFTTPPPPPSRTTEENGNVVVLVYHKHAGLGHGLFGAPLILCFTATPTYLELTRAIYDQIKRTLLAPPSALSTSAPGEHELLPMPPLRQSTDSDSVELTESTERMFPPERLRALAEAAAVLEPTPAAPPGEPEPEPEWLTALEDEAFRRVARHLKLTTQVSTFTDRTLTYGDGGMLDINSRDQVTAHYLGELDARYDPSTDRAYPRHESCQIDANNNGASVPLSECLDLFMKREQLGADNPWYCSVCKEHRRAYKKFDIWRWPKVLVVHLKRFSFSNAISNRFVSRGKLDTLVTFPIDNLDIRSHAIGDASTCTDYQLYAISNHMGGMGGGHYIAHATHDQSAPLASEAAWECFDDHHVSSVEQRVLTSPTAYLLFYRRKDSVAANEAELEQYERDRPNRERQQHQQQQDEANDETTTTTTTSAATMADLDALTQHGPSSNGVLVALDDPILPSSSTEGLPDVPATQPDDGGFSD